MNFKTAQQIIYGAVMAMPDPVPGYNNDWNKKQERNHRIDQRAQVLCFDRYRHMDAEDVGFTLDRIAQSKDLYTAIANELRAGRKDKAIAMICDWIENDMWDKSLDEAEQEIDEL